MCCGMQTPNCLYADPLYKLLGDKQLTETHHRFWRKWIKDRYFFPFDLSKKLSPTITKRLFRENFRFKIAGLISFMFLRQTTQ